MTSADGPPVRDWCRTGLVVAILAGAVLRLIWPGDIEYKPDEDYSMYYALNRDGADALPRVGMPSSTGVPNFGLSVWSFAFLGYAFDVKSPVDLARGVAVCSILAMALYLPFIRRLVPEREREAWHWGVALMALSPLAVFLHRKIWPPALFPLMTLVLLAGWLRRGTAIGAFGFGLMGALVGQVHMSGFFFAAAFVLWALLFDRHSIKWRYWLLGSAVGSLGLIPWVLEVCENPALLGAKGGASWTHPAKGLFWIRWFIQPYGFDTLNNSLGASFWDFLRQPQVAGTPTYLVGGLHAVSAILFLAIGLQLLRQWWRQRGEWRSLFGDRSSPTSFALAAAFWGFGILLMTTGRPFRYYYFLIAMPLIFVWTARQALSLDRGGNEAPRRCLLALCVAQGLISLAFLDFVHSHPHGIRGDFGVPYGAQEPQPPTGTLSKHMRAGGK